MSTNPEEIRREIQRTQARLGEKVEALAQQKTHVKEDVKEAIAEKAAEVKDTVIDKVIGKKEELSAKVAEKKSEVAEMASKAEDKVVESAEAAKEKVMGGSAGERPYGDVSEAGVSRMERTFDSVVATKDAVASKMKDALPDGEALKEKARGVASSTLAKLPDREDLRRGASKAEAAIVDNPAVLALGSLAAGLLIGLAVPLTSTERQKVGPLASQARIRAIATGTRAAAEQVSQKVDRGMDVVAQRVSEKIDTLADQLKETAEKVGFGDVVQNAGERMKEGVVTLAGEVAGRARDKVNEVAEREESKEKVAEKGGQERSAGTQEAAGSDPVPAGSSATRRYLR